MKYAGIIKNDLAAAPGISTTFFVQGCPIKCPGCHNPEAQSFESGKDFSQSIIDELEQALFANGIQRTLCIMGGEPLCAENLFLTELIIREIKKDFPHIKIYIWTGYTYEELLKNSNKSLRYILSTIDTLVDGPYIESQRDITLPMRGSRNQRIIDLK